MRNFCDILFPARLCFQFDVECEMGHEKAPLLVGCVIMYPHDETLFRRMVTDRFRERGLEVDKAVFFSLRENSRFPIGLLRGHRAKCAPTDHVKATATRWIRSDRASSEKSRPHRTCRVGQRRAGLRCSLNEGEIRDQAAAVVGSVICFTSGDLRDGKCSWPGLLIVAATGKRSGKAKSNKSILCAYSVATCYGYGREQRGP